jgi:hypothetical protein
VNLPVSCQWSENGPDLGLRSADGGAALKDHLGGTDDGHQMGFRCDGPTVRVMTTTLRWKGAGERANVFEKCAEG